jgi:hypothetical protein
MLINDARPWQSTALLEVHDGITRARTEKAAIQLARWKRKSVFAQVTVKVFDLFTKRSNL